MTDADDEAPAGGRELKWATYIGFGAPIVLGTFFGNILEYVGLMTRGLAWGFWVQTYAFMFGGFIALSVLWPAWALLGWGRTRAGAAIAIVSGLGLAVVGILYPVTLWWLAGPLAVVGGGRALLGSQGSRDEARQAQA